MVSCNLTGADNLTLGKGELYLARCVGEAFEGFRKIGNAPEFTLTFERENLEHFDSRSGINEKDADVTTQVTRTGTIVTDNINEDNLALFFFGDTQTVVQAAQSIVNEEINGVVTNRTHVLGLDETNPTGLRNIDAGSVVVTDDTGTTTFVQGTDYTLQVQNGFLEIPEGSNIPAGSDILVSYDVVASTRNRVISGGEQVIAQVMFVSDNGIGENRTVLLPRVSISADGDFAFIGDEFQTLSLAIEALKPSDGREAIYVDGIPAIV